MYKQKWFAMDFVYSIGTLVWFWYSQGYININVYVVNRLNKFYVEEIRINKNILAFWYWRLRFFWRWNFRSRLVVKNIAKDLENENI